jgi:hypothetical protein
MVQLWGRHSRALRRISAFYRRYNAKDHSRFALNAPDREKLGEMERLLGYALEQ